MTHKHPPKKKTNPYVLLIVSLLLVVVFAFIFLSSEQLVGQAFVKGTVNAGLLSSGDVLEVWANVGEKETLGVQFTLRLPPGVSCSTSIGVKTQTLGWSEDNGLVSSQFECIGDSILGDKIEFEYFVLDQDVKKTDEFKIAEINLKELDQGPYDFKFTSFKIHDGENFVITSGDGILLTIGEAKSCAGYEKFGDYSESSTQSFKTDYSSCFIPLQGKASKIFFSEDERDEDYTCLGIYKGVPLIKTDNLYQILYVKNDLVINGIDHAICGKEAETGLFTAGDASSTSGFKTLEGLQKCVDEGIKQKTLSNTDKLLTCMAPPETDVYGCKVLNEREETYTLKEDIYFGGIAGDVCFSIEADDITLDCNGYTISGLTSKNQKVSEAKEFKDAVEIKADKVTVQNCDFEYVGTAVSGEKNEDIVFKDNTVVSYDFGVNLDYYDGVLIGDNEFLNGNRYASLVNTKNAKIKNNKIEQANGVIEGSGDKNSRILVEGNTFINIDKEFLLLNNIDFKNNVIRGSTVRLGGQNILFEGNEVCPINGETDNSQVICNKIDFLYGSTKLTSVTGSNNYIHQVGLNKTEIEDLKKKFNWTDDSPEFKKYLESFQCGWPKSTDYQSCDKVPAVIPSGPTPPDPTTPTNTTPTNGTTPPVIGETSSSESTNKGGFRSKCTWDCEYWTPCNGTLQQERTCFPGRRCYAKPKVEVKSCKTCNPSWFCGSWSDSVNDCGTRTCVDERSCGISFGKPVTSNTCPTKVTLQSPAPVTGTSGGYIPEYDPSSPSIWSTFKNIIIGSVLGVALIGILLSIVVYFMMHKKGPEVGPLVSWIKTMKSRKSSDTQIKQILRDQGTWTPEDVKEAFRKIK